MTSMPESEKQQVFGTCEGLIQKEEFDVALKLLEPFQCIIATWMKGRIYLTIAEKMANSFVFKNYPTETMKKQYQEILSCAYDYLYQTGCLMPDASNEIREQLNPIIWYQIGKVENELTRLKPMPEEKNDDYYDEDYQMDENHEIESMIDLIGYWDL